MLQLPCNHSSTLVRIILTQILITTIKPNVYRYFKPHNIEGMGRFQDGGLWRNNPLDIGRSEAKTLWRGVGIDNEWSLGTAYRHDHFSSSSPHSPLDIRRPQVNRPNSGKAIGSKFGLFRFFRSSLDSVALHGEKMHILTSKLQSDEHSRSSYRLNLALPEEPPALDDVPSMLLLRDATLKRFAHDPILDEMVDKSLSTLFFFQMTTRPIRNRKNVRCRGFILCDIEPGPILVNFLYKLTYDDKSEFRIADKTICLAGSNIDQLDTQPFQIALDFTTQNLDSPFAISLHIGERQRRVGYDISNSPFTLRRIMSLQGWNTPFGIEQTVDPKSWSSPKRGHDDDAHSRRTRPKVERQSTIGALREALKFVPAG